MTAGQRNCYEIISDKAESYGLDDVLFAVREVIREAAKGDLTNHVFYREAFDHVETARQQIAQARATQ